MSDSTYLDDASEPFVALPGPRDVALLNDAFSAAEWAYRSAGYSEISTNYADQVRLASCLGDAAQSVLDFYVNKGLDDASHGIGERGYEPWSDIGLPIPFENVEIESREDGVEWLRIGEIGPIPFGYINALPKHVVTMCLQRTENRDGFQVVFVGRKVDHADGDLL